MTTLTASRPHRELSRTCALGSLLRIAGLIVAVMTTIGFTLAMSDGISRPEHGLILLAAGAAIGAVNGSIIAGIGQALIYLHKIAENTSKP